MTIDVAGVVELLERAVGGDDRERLDRACARYCAGPAGLAGVFAQSAPIGVVGYLHHADGRGTIRQALALDGRLDKTQHDCMTRPPSER